MIINKFKEIVDSRGMKQKFIIDKTGLSPSAMSAIYNGQIPLLLSALKISKVLGLKVEDIWSLNDIID